MVNVEKKSKVMAFRQTEEPNKGLWIVPSKTNPEWAWMNVVQTTYRFNGKTYFKSQRKALVTGPKEFLEMDLKESKGEYSGHIFRFECVETDVPQEIKDMYFDNRFTDAENIAKNPRWYKANGDVTKGGVLLTLNGARILKFNIWDPNGEMADVRVQHDNVGEARNASLKMRMLKNAEKVEFKAQEEELDVEDVEETEEEA
jgi:hypothetical protein